MKAVMVLFALLLLSASVAAVAGAAAAMQGSGAGQQERTRDQTQERLQEQEHLANRTRLMNATQLQEQLQEKLREQEQAGMAQDRQGVFPRYSNVSAFVRVLLEEAHAGTLFGGDPGGIGPQVAGYAREFNNSLQSQIRAEERIENRNTFIRFLFGGDGEAAGIMEQESVQNRERIRQMQQLVLNCSDCDPRVREMLQERLLEMEQEQVRLQQLAQKERQDRGIIGWLWR